MQRGPGDLQEPAGKKQKSGAAQEAEEEAELEGILDYNEYLRKRKEMARVAKIKGQTDIDKLAGVNPIGLDPKVLQDPKIYRKMKALVHSDAQQVEGLSVLFDELIKIYTQPMSKRYYDEARKLEYVNQVDNSDLQCGWKRRPSGDPQPDL